MSVTVAEEPESSLEGEAAIARLAGLGAVLWRYRELALIVAITAFAAGLRFWQLTTLPFGFHNDEGNVTLDAQRVLDEGWIGPYSLRALGYPIAFNYFVAPFLAVLGWGVLAVRLPAAILGTAAIPLMYLVARNAAGWRAGLCAAVLLAVSLWHLQLSRLGFPVIGWPAAELAAILCLQYGLRTRHWGWFIPAGLVAGISIWIYPSASAFVVGVAIAVGVWLALRLWSERRSLGVPFARDVVLLAIFGLSTFLGAWPMIEYTRENPVSERFDSVYVFGDRRREDCLKVTPEQRDQKCQYAVATGFADRVDVLREKTQVLWRSLVSEPRVDNADGVGSTPPVGRLAMYLALAGAVVAVARYRRMDIASGIALAAAPLIAGFTIVTLDGQYRRSFGLVPFIALFGGMALAFAWEWLEERGRWLGMAAAAGVAVVLVVAGAGSVRWYFDDYAHQPGTRFTFFPEMRRASEYIDSLGHPYVYFYSDRASIGHESRQVLAPDIAGGEDRSEQFTRDDPKAVRYDLAPHSNPAFPITRDPDGAVFILMNAYAIEEREEYALDDIQARYPGGQVRMVTDPEWNSVEYIAYYLPRDLLESYASKESVEFKPAPPP
ncbi:MAG TPA: glycosyltransferase family 39 protein [Dehalococcoidia bacterium]|nr:glycosyltransferase family 39 protein [Dehalococcoidia bacterium]